MKISYLPGAINALEKAGMQDTSREVGDTTLISLGKITMSLDQKHPYHWLMKLSHECSNIHQEAGRPAARQYFVQSGRMSDIRKALEEHDESIRHVAVCLLRYLPPSKITPRFLRLLKTDPSPVIRHEIPFLLVGSKMRGVRKEIVYAMFHDSSFLVRHEAAEALGESGDKSMIPFLAQALRNDSNEAVRLTAQRAIEQLKYHTRSS